MLLSVVELVGWSLRIGCPRIEIVSSSQHISDGMLICGPESVLIIERGYFDDKPQAILPYYANGVDESVMMRPTSAPVARLNNQTFGVAVAAVVGGGSGMFLFHYIQRITGISMS
jgi:hypothetical protein